MPYNNIDARHQAQQEFPIADRLVQTAVLLKSGIHRIDTSTTTARVPVLADTEPAWTGEGQEIAVSEDDPREILLVPQPVKSLTRISNEAASDSANGVVAGIERGGIKDLAAACDAGFFVGRGYDENEPVGLFSSVADLPTDATLAVDYPGLARAAGKLRAAGADADVAYLNPLDLVELQLASDTANRPLVNTAADGTPEFVAGLRLWPSAAIPQGQALVAEAWEIVAAIRTDARFDISGDAAFSADSIMIRGVSRVDVAVKNPEATVIIGEAEEG